MSAATYAPGSSLAVDGGWTAFGIEPEVDVLRDRVRAFVADVAIPAEPRDRSAYGPDDRPRTELQEAAKAAAVRGRSA